jgi:hypothetical protein
VPATTIQRSLFETSDGLPEGMRYASEVVSREEEEALLREIPALPFKEFEFRGFLGKRRVVSFGWNYDFNGGGLGRAGGDAGIPPTGARSRGGLCGP